ncbi:MAG: heavy-metal-associated domain-containing protein [Saprospiraceae bacterium]|nr:heavy-metal-associated domain-containing protein [Saprospiraceae bacterium]MBK6664634.1 heavy-metal-associated domain-containing protein [Saprospiraceae bacterium]MBK7698686.1 heavy-metal-associated domain-containing protein [Saprospiraceae bacterium]MBK8826317.1 heavy-metal-associated domain-containing protein [Saprospiraceae bacterium]MBK8885020.1 heavy-metal-associated domain-containing protein [Saprospiraceae bacterium]
MSTLNKILLLLIFSVTCLLHSSQLPAQLATGEMKKTELQKSRTVELSVTGMTCQKGCADGIDKKLKKTQGIIRSKTKLTTGICKVTFDESQISLDQIIAVIDNLGYKAKLNS